MIVTKFNSLIKTRTHEAIQIQFFFFKVSRKGKRSPYRRKKTNSYKGNGGNTNSQLDKMHGGC